MARSGRSAIRQAVPFLFVPALLVLVSARTGPVAAQGPEVQLRVGAVASSPLAGDEVASALVRQRVGAPVATSVSARPRPAPTLGLAVQQPVRPGVAAELAVGHARSSLRVVEADGAVWDGGHVSVWQGFVGIRWQWRRAVALSGAFGALHYRADGRAFFARGGELNPGVEAALHGTLPWGGERAGVRLYIQMHRFNTPTLRQAGASDGGVLRAGVQATFRMRAAGRP